MRSSELYKHAIERLGDVTNDLHNLFVIFFAFCFDEGREKELKKFFVLRLSRKLLP